jgi:CRISPR-associated protein Csx17
MTVHVHRLEGCRPSPLAHYLKALGVLRLVAEQKDPDARGCWRNDAFLLATRLEMAELVAFFLDQYAPTPLVGPWNGGSGFYPKDNTEGPDALAGANAERFTSYREAIDDTRALVKGRTERPADEEKAALIAKCRRIWPKERLRWLDAALVLAGEGVMYPALLGTGGNDGRLDFTNNFMQRLSELFDVDSGTPRADAEPLLRSALTGSPCPGLIKASIGQFHPGGAGGANSGPGFSGGSLVNRWDFVLMLEGALVLPVAALRRLDGCDLPQAAAPFAVRPRASGYASAAPSDESARGEQWMPLWTHAATFPEVEALFVEGRLQAGASRAVTAVDASQALSHLGTARGVTAFERFGYAERNGQSNLAVPLGRWEVAQRPSARLLGEITPWVDELRHKADSNVAPESLGAMARRIDDALLTLSREPGLPFRWGELLVRIGETEDLLASRPKFTAEARLKPAPRLSMDWIDLARDGSVEFRLAAAIASQVAPTRANKTLGPIRANCIPLDLERRQPMFSTGAGALLKDPAVVWTGDLITSLASIAQRRLVDGARLGLGGFPLVGKVFPSLDDVNLFIGRATDDARIAALARGLMALDWEKCGAEHRIQISKNSSAGRPSALHALFRLMHLAEPLDDLKIGLDRAPLRLLLAGRLDGAARVALQRLVSSGLRPKVYLVAGSAVLARRLAASLSIPIARTDLDRLKRAVTKPEEIC